MERWLTFLPPRTRGGGAGGGGRAPKKARVRVRTSPAGRPAGRVNVPPSGRVRTTALVSKPNSTSYIYV